MIMEDLGDGSVDAAADLLMVMAPGALDEPSRFAIDQYLMRGGTVILATSPTPCRPAGNSLMPAERDSGLGTGSRPTASTSSDTLVLDERNAAFPLPVVRRVSPATSSATCSSWTTPTSWTSATTA
jgi:ABC-2 type transport system permease protein